MSKKDIFKIAIAIIILSTIAKILSLITKIIIARNLSTQALTYYSLCAPTMVFFIALAQLGLPATISKIVADQKIQNEKPILASIIIALINNILLVFLLMIFIPLLSTIFLKNSNLKEILYAIVILLPLVTLSGILKGYFTGKQKHVKTSVASIIEEISRAGFILIMFYNNPHLSDVQMATLAMLSISVGELGTILFLSFNLIKTNKYFETLHLKEPIYYKMILNTCIPLTTSRMIGSFTFFIEPFIIMSICSKSLLSGMQSHYGLIHGYILPILTLPNFISFTLANYVLPTFTYEYSLKHFKRAQQAISTSILINTFISIICALVVYTYPQQIIKLLYDKDNLAIITPILKDFVFLFAICSSQSILSSILQATNNTRKALIDTSVGSVFRILTIILFTNILKEKVIILALFIGMLTTSLMHAYRTFALVFEHYE